MTAAQRLIGASGIDEIISSKDKVAVKIHVGERDNDTHVSSEIVKVIVSMIKEKEGFPFLTETSTLYAGQRSNAIDHLVQAFSHGFTGVLASRNPVAIDQAALDITERKFGASLAEKCDPHLDPTIQLKHAEKIGLGLRKYNLVII